MRRFDHCVSLFGFQASCVVAGCQARGRWEMFRLRHTRRVSRRKVWASGRDVGVYSLSSDSFHACIWYIKFSGLKLSSAVGASSRMAFLSGSGTPIRAPSWQRFVVLIIAYGTSSNAPQNLEGQEPFELLSLADTIGGLLLADHE